MSRPLTHQHPPRVSVVADDLTGAAEICAIGVSFGFEARIRLWQEIDQPWGTHENTAVVLAIDTDSRSLTPAEAASRVARATDMISQTTPSFVYKKVDSILRGNVVPEILAMLRALRRRKCILVPCNPTLGRTIRNGTYFIDGKSIDQTQFRHDPTWPRTSPLVSHMLAGHDNIVTAKPIDDLPPAQIIVGEASTYSDVARWAMRLPDGCLPAGGSDFFRACIESALGIAAPAPETFKAPATPQCPHNGWQTRDLFICGSASESTLSFVERMRTCGLPVITLPGKACYSELTHAEIEQLGAILAEAMLKNNRVMLAVGLPPVRDPNSATRLADWLVRAASRAIAEVRPDRIFAEGGATAVALARQMNWCELRVLGELARGVAITQPVASYAPEFIIKPGSYPWPASVRQ